MKISTIIPIYNTANYLNKCIDSIINQTIGFNNIELILINDGSTDDSENIIKKYLKKYPEIKYINQKNMGQAAARNNGLKISTGEYISFVDSDDYLELEMYKELYEFAKEKKCDILTFDHYEICENTRKYCNNKWIDDENKNYIIMNAGPLNILSKRDFLIKEKFKFPEGIIYEDLAVIPSLGINAKVKHLSKAFYNYIIRKGSTMNMKKYSSKLEDIFKSIDILTNHFKEKDIKNKYYEELEYIYIRRILMSASLRFIQFNDPDDMIKKIITLIKNRYPKWRKNVYYNKLSIKKKVVALLVYNNMKKTLGLLYKLNKRLQ